jgi:hypothetical protein
VSLPNGYDTSIAASLLPTLKSQPEQVAVRKTLAQRLGFKVGAKEEEKGRAMEGAGRR